jgi:hypothetical protein
VLLVFAGCAPSKAELEKEALDATRAGVLARRVDEVAERIACEPRIRRDDVAKGLRAKEFDRCGSPTFSVRFSSEGDYPEVLVTCADGTAVFSFRPVRAGTCGTENRGLAITSIAWRQADEGRYLFHEAFGSNVPK